MGLSVGIDFGTSNSGVAVFDGSRVHLLPIDDQNVVPEVVKTTLYITKDYRHTIGQEAIELYYKHNVNRLRRFVKKWVGEIDFRGAELFYVRDVYVYVDELKPGRLLQYIKTALRSEGYQGTQIFERYYSTADLVAAYLQALKERAEKLLGEPITRVTLGRPVQFSPNPAQDQKAADTLIQAAQQAGFEQVELEYEPVAAALFYEQSLERPQNVLVFDFGGGTLDITIMSLGDPHKRHVFSSGGIGIAGSDFDRAIIEKRLLAHFGKGLVDDKFDLIELVNTVADWIALPDLSTPQARLRLKHAIQEGVAPARLKALESLIFNDLAFTFYNAVEGAKIALSVEGASLIRMQAQDIDLWELYTRHQFEHDIREYRSRIESVLLDTLIRSGLETEQIDAVVKTGGSSYIPAFSDMLARLFGSERVRASDMFNSVTAGLAIKAYHSRQ
jgi:hypothetical chaperone protein